MPLSITNTRRMGIIIHHYKVMSGSMHLFFSYLTNLKFNRGSKELFAPPKIKHDAIISKICDEYKYLSRHYLLFLDWFSRGCYVPYSQPHYDMLVYTSLFFFKKVLVLLMLALFSNECINRENIYSPLLHNVLNNRSKPKKLPL